MILVMLVSLYTSRVILAKLGVEDYGIYNVVGGIVAMFSFLNSSMATSTQRYLTYALGKNDNELLKNVFAISLNIHIVIAIFIIILAETFGLWMLNTHLVIPPDRLMAANWVFQLSILTFSINIIQVPYNASIIAHERMNVYAYISIIEVVLKLIIVYILSLTTFDRLIFYAILVFLVQLVVRVIYQAYCRCRFVECHLRFYWDKQLYKEMFGFAGWNMFGSVAWLMRGQGLDIVLNLFFGPIVNAARGITNQVSGAVMSFISNFQVALNPQITKKYAQGEIEQMESLAYNGIKFSLLLLFIIAFPLCLNIDYVLGLWLKDVPRYTSIFIILVIIDSIVNSFFGTPLMTSLSATGTIRNYQIVVSSVILLVVPCSYFLLKLGCDAPSVFIAMILVSLISGFTRLLFCKKLIGFSLYKFFRQVVMPIVLTFIVAVPIPVFIRLRYFVEDNLQCALMTSVIALIISLICGWFIGLNVSEKSMIVSIIKNRVKRNND